MRYPINYYFIKKAAFLSIHQNGNQKAAGHKE